MQSRRYEDFDTQSPRVRGRRLDLVREPYLMRRSPQPRRSLSPRRMEVPRKVLVGNRRSNSIERNDYVWDLGPNRAGGVQSRSPPFAPLLKRPHYDEGGTSRELRLPEMYRSSGMQSRSPPLAPLLKRPHYDEEGKSRELQPPEMYRSSRLQSRSPSLAPLPKRPHYEEDGTSRELRPPEVYRRYENSDYDIGTGYKDDYQYKQSHATSKGFSEEFDGGLLDPMLVQKPMVSEDLAPPGKYVEYGGKLSSPSMNMVLGDGRSKDERVQYPEPIVSNKFSEKDTYEKGEKRILHSRDTSHQFKDFTSTSSGNPRVNYSASIRVGVPLPSDEQHRSSGKLQQTLIMSEYGQQLDPQHEEELKDLELHRLDRRREAGLKDLELHRLDRRREAGLKDLELHRLDRRREAELKDLELHRLDRRREAELKDLELHRLDRRHEAELKDLEIHRLDRRHEAEFKDLEFLRLDRRHEAELKDLEHHRLDYRHEAELKDPVLHLRDTFSPPRAEHRDYLYARLEERERDDYGYPSDEMYRRVALSERIDYDFDHNYFRRATMVDPVTEQVRNPEFPCRNPSSSNLYEDPYLEHKQVSNHIIDCKSSATSKHGAQYLDPVGDHIEFGRKIPKEQHIQYLGESYDPKVSHMRLDYGVERDTGLISGKERIRRSPEIRYQTERLGFKTNAVKAEALGTYEQSDRMLKRKYTMVDEIERHDPRTIVSSEWIDSGGTRDRNPQEWLDQDDASGLILSKRLGYDLNRSAERTFDRADRYRGSAFDDSVKQSQDFSNKTYKPVGRNTKGNSRPVYLNWHNSFQSDKRHVFPKPNSVWVQGKDENRVDQQGIEFEKSEPPEDSEDFKELVQKHFMAYTKKLNENLMVGKRYKEDGRAGSLYCIVCGRSTSKEFMNTKRLVNHCFMSHKPGLRTQHLGLQKAICVLLGWSNVVPTDVTTWTPDMISIAEASAQKEDLIIWPPVILIHNTSLPDHHDPQCQPNITIEALEEFLRGKGLGGGKVRFGKPGHHSIMVVKFLGTFSGLQDAEKLQNYFVDNKRGRKDFKQIGLSKGKSKEGGKFEDGKVDELLLYGYMGIAEDLARVDLDTKRKCSIKSKKEIQDLVEAPVKT